MSLLKLREAAEMIGVSYPTLKQWIYKNKIRSVTTAGGHHRIPQEEVERVLNTQRKIKTAAPLAMVSGRNKLFGTILEVRIEGLLAQITLDVSGQIVTSIITSDAARSLNLKKGITAYALVKATEVMILRE